MVVACVAGVGASAGIFVQEVGDVATYAEELFGAGSDARAISYPNEVTANRPAFGGSNTGADSDPEPGVTVYPWVRVNFTLDRAVDTAGGDTDLDAVEGTTAPDATDPGEATFEMTFSLSSGMFAETVGAAHLTATGTATISVQADGASGDDSVTFRIEADLGDDDAFTFQMPRLKGLEGLGANDQLAPFVGSYAQADDVKVSVATRLISGPAGIPSSGVSSFVCPAGTPIADACNDTMARAGSTLPGMIVVKDESAVSLSIDDGNPDGGKTADIDIDKRTNLNDGAVRHELGKLVLQVNQGGTGANEAILQWDGSRVDDDLSGVIQLTAAGDMGLFQDGDMVFADYNGDKAASANETFSGSGDTMSFSGFSTDPDDVGSDERKIAVYYVPGGKMELRHGSSITLSSAIRFNDPSATHLPDAGDIYIEKDYKTTTVLMYKGVGAARKAYAIPFAGNGKGDKANVRIRCESGAGSAKECRVFLECFDDMGMRSFGESDRIPHDAVNVLDSEEVEMTVGVSDAMSRHSCRILTTGSSSVQQLTRDGTTGTLVNNTYVEDM